MENPPRWLVPALLVLVVAASLAAGGVGLAGGTAGSSAVANAKGPCTGTVTDPAKGRTIVSVQGAKGGQFKPAKLVGLKPNGRVAWVHRARKGTVWSYDVDPLPNGNLFVTTTIRENDDGDTVVYEYNQRTGEVVWKKRFEALDTHDADLIDGGRAILLANMRNNGPDNEGDRILIYNRTQGEITWQWKFANHGFNRSGGGNYSEDWTHVNDVDMLGNGRILISPRNFDQVLIIDRSSKKIVHRLGADNNYKILKEQHNPDFLVGPNGRPTVLVADSENDRVVEYTLKDGEWVRTWQVSGNLNWPRDADRLPNGNTLIVDSWNHRVIEVTPKGKIVWEAYTPWLVYDAERVRTGGGSRGPTMAEVGVTGNYTLHGGSGMHKNMSALERCAKHLRTFQQRTATPFPGRTGPKTATGSAEWYYGKDLSRDWTVGPLELGGLGVGFGIVFAILVAVRTRT